MDQVTLFTYSSGESVLHRLDPRFKLLFILLISIGSIGSTMIGLLPASVMILASFRSTKINILQLPGELKLFLYFLLFILFTRALSIPGETIVSIGPAIISKEGILSGITVCWRLALIILCSLGFIVSTTSAEIKGSVEFYLSKIPFIPEKRVSTMLSLLIRFIPLIFTQIQQTMDAQRARCIDVRKNPVYRLTKLTIPTMHRIFHSGDQLTIAMESRCYNEQRTGPNLTSSNIDKAALCVVVLLVLAMIIL